VNKHSVLVCTGAVAAGLLAATVSSAQPAGDAQLKALEGRFAKAFAAKDLDGIMKVYAPQGITGGITGTQYLIETAPAVSRK